MTALYGCPSVLDETISGNIVTQIHHLTMYGTKTYSLLLQHLVIYYNPKLLFFPRRMYLRWSAHVAQFLSKQACQFNSLWLIAWLYSIAVNNVGCLFQPHCATSQLRTL